MNIEYMLDAMDMWLNKNYPEVPPEEIDFARLTTVFEISRGSVKEIAHLKHMIIEMKAMPTDNEKAREKLMRWIGFMQGSLWALGFYSIDNFREMNA